MTATKVDVWAWWRSAVAGKLLPIKESEPRPGFYKHRSGDPVAFWFDKSDGSLRCKRAGKTVPGHGDQMSLWVSVAKSAVPHEAWKFAEANGRWESEPEASPVLSNLPADPFEALRAELADKMASAEKWLREHPEAKNKTECDYAKNLQSELLALEKKADDMFKAEKQPHLDASREVDKRFKFREGIAPVAKTLRGIFGRFMAAEEERQNAAARAKYEAERRAAEKARAEVEAQRAKQMRDDPIAALTSPEPELPELPMGPEPVKIKAGGAVGRAAGLKTEWMPEVTDYKAALEHFADHDEVKSAVWKLIKAATRAGKGSTKIPGVTIKETRVAA